MAKINLFTIISKNSLHAGTSKIIATHGYENYYLKSILQIFKTIACLFITLILIGRCWGQAGTLDESFGDGGKVREEIGTGEQTPYSIVVQKDQKIVCAGIIVDSLGVSHIFLLRYNSNGSRDSSFGTNGGVLTFLDSGAYCKAMTLQFDGKILITGYSGISLLVIRYNTNGSLDSSFGTNGIVLTKFGNNAVGSSIITDESKSIFVAGSINHNDVALLKYKPNGYLDSTFGHDGKVSTDILNHTDEAVSFPIFRTSQKYKIH